MNTNKIINDAINEIAFGDGRKAEATLTHLADQGNGQAAFELGILYRTGAIGVNQDKEKSNYWLNKSDELGFQAADSSDPD